VPCELTSTRPAETFGSFEDLGDRHPEHGWTFFRFFAAWRFVPTGAVRWVDAY
jgi:hypothetical protein